MTGPSRRPHPPATGPRSPPSAAGPTSAPPISAATSKPPAVAAPAATPGPSTASAPTKAPVPTQNTKAEPAKPQSKTRKWLGRLASGLDKLGDEIVKAANEVEAEEKAGTAKTSATASPIAAAKVEAKASPAASSAAPKTDAKAASAVVPKPITKTTRTTSVPGAATPVPGPTSAIPAAKDQTVPRAALAPNPPSTQPKVAQAAVSAGTTKELDDEDDKDESETLHQTSPYAAKPAPKPTSQALNDAAAHTREASKELAAVEHGETVDADQYRGTEFGQSSSHTSQNNREISGYTSNAGRVDDQDHDDDGGEEMSARQTKNKGYNKAAIVAGGVGGGALAVSAAYGYYDYEQEQDENDAEVKQHEEHGTPYLEAEAQDEGHSASHEFDEGEIGNGTVAEAQDRSLEHDGGEQAYEYGDYAQHEQAQEADEFEHEQYQQEDGSQAEDEDQNLAGDEQVEPEQYGHQATNEEINYAHYAYRYEQDDADQANDKENYEPREGHEYQHEQPEDEEETVGYQHETDQDYEQPKHGYEEAAATHDYAHQEGDYDDNDDDDDDDDNNGDSDYK